VEFQIGMANYNAIYASFAAFPIFLVWIYVSWVTVMFGAEFAHAHQGARHHRMLKNLDLDLRRKRDLLVLRGCVEITEAFLEGRGPLRQDDVAEALAVPTSTLARELEPVVEAGLLAAATIDDDDAWTVGRQPSKITMSEIFATVHGMNTRPESQQDTVLEAYRSLLGSLTASESNFDLEALTRKTRKVADHRGDDED
jgi:membrane protein